MRVIYWLNDNLKIVSIFVTALAVAFVMGMCVGVASANYDYDNQAVYDRFNQFSNITYSQYTNTDVLPDTAQRWRFLTPANGGAWFVATGLMAETTLSNAGDHILAIYSDVDDQFRVQADITRNNTGQLLGLVAKSNGVIPTSNVIFAWHDGAGTWTLSKLVGGSFAVIGTGSETWTTGTRTVSLAFDGQQVVLRSGAHGSSTFDTVRITSALTASDVTALDGFSYHGLFSRAGSLTPSSFDNFSVTYNPQPVEVEPVDFTPFLYASAFLLGIAFIGIGEYARQMMYTTLGGLIIIGSAIATGLTWLMILTGIGFLAVGYRAIVLFFRERSAVE